MVRPFRLAGFDPRQVGALPRRPRLPSSRATGAAFFAEIVHRTISDRSSPPGQARFRASPRQARPDYRRWAWGTPLACGLKPSGNRTVKTLRRSVFSQSSGRAVSSLAALFPVRFSTIVFGLHRVAPTPARHKTPMRCFHQASSCSIAEQRNLVALWIAKIAYVEVLAVSRAKAGITLILPARSQRN